MPDLTPQHIRGTDRVGEERRLQVSTSRDSVRNRAVVVESEAATFAGEGLAEGGVVGEQRRVGTGRDKGFTQTKNMRKGVVVEKEGR